MSPNRSCCSRTRIASGCSPPTCRSTTARPRLIYDAGHPRRSSSSGSPSTRATSTRVRRGRSRSSRASTAWGIRSSCTSSRTASSRCPTRAAAMTVYGSLQCPYYVHRALDGAARTARRQGPRVQTETGGGFGGKEEYPSMIAGHAALLALKGGPAGEAGLRPGRGHARDDQAPPGGRSGIAPASRATAS